MNQFGQDAVLSIDISDSLLIPEVNSKPELIGWNQTATRFQALPEPFKASILDAFLQKAQQHPDPALRHHIVKMSGRDQHQCALRLAMLGAVLGGITVFVWDAGNSLYSLRSEIWLGTSPFVINPIVLALTGRFIPLTPLLPSCCPEVKMAGNDLFIKAGDANRIVRLHRGNEAALTDACKDWIVDFQKEHAGCVPTTDRAIDDLRILYPKASKRSLTKAFNTVKPRAWAEPGRRKPIP